MFSVRDLMLMYILYDRYACLHIQRYAAITVPHGAPGDGGADDASPAEASSPSSASVTSPSSTAGSGSRFRFLPEALAFG